MRADLFWDVHEYICTNTASRSHDTAARSVMRALLLCALLVTACAGLKRAPRAARPHTTLYEFMDALDDVSLECTTRSNTRGSRVACVLDVPSHVVTTATTFLGAFEEVLTEAFGPEPPVYARRECYAACDKVY